MYTEVNYSSRSAIFKSIMSQRNLWILKKKKETYTFTSNVNLKKKHNTCTHKNNNYITTHVLAIAICIAESLSTGFAYIKVYWFLFLCRTISEWLWVTTLTHRCWPARSSTLSMDVTIKRRTGRGPRVCCFNILRTVVSSGTSSKRSITRTPPKLGLYYPMKRTCHWF